MATASALSSVAVEGSSSPEKGDARGMERTLTRGGEHFSFTIRPENSRSSGYLLVNNSNASFALASMS